MLLSNQHQMIKKILLGSILNVFVFVPALAQYPGNTANGQLTIAILMNKIEDVKKALEMKELNINAKNEEGETPLMDAVRINTSLQSPGDLSDPVEIVKLLIDHGADVNAKDNKGFTALLIICCQSGYGTLTDQTVRVAKLLIEKGATINFNRVEYDINEGTPLTNACLNAKTDLIKLLIEKGANINAKGSDDENPLTILLNVASTHMTEATKIKLIQILIAKGANPLQANDRGETAKSIAKQNYSKDIIDALNGKVIAIKEEKKTIYEVEGIKLELSANGQLAAACLVGNLDDLKLAINNGAEVNKIVAEGYTGLELLCQFTSLKPMRDRGRVSGTNTDLIAERVKMVDYIIQKGARLNFPDNSHSALFMATSMGIIAVNSGELTTKDYLPIINILVNKGALSTSISGLNYAICMGEMELVKAMLPKVNNINLTTGTESTPLMNCVAGCGYNTTEQKASRLEILKLLIAKGAKVNQAVKGQTPLMLARSSNNAAMIQALIKAGAK